MPNDTVTGLDEFLQYLDASPAKVQQGVHVGLYAGAQLIEAAAKANCPVEHGELRDSIHASIRESGTKVTATVKAGGRAPDGKLIAYAHLVEFTGAAPHDIVEKNGGVIHHPGMRAHPFLRPAVDTNEVAAIGLVDQQIESALNEK